MEEDNFNNPYAMSYDNPYDNQSMLNPFSDSNITLNAPYHSEKTQSNKKNINVLYQIAQFKNSQNKKYHVRKFLFNNECDEMKWREGYLTNKKVNSLKNRYSAHQYNIYPVYNLQQIPLPTVGELLHSTSELISNNNSYTGYAKF